MARRPSPEVWILAAKVWDLEQGKCLKTLKGHSGFINSVSITPDGTKAISGSSDKSLILWDLESDAPEREEKVREQTISCLSVNPVNNTVITGGYDKNLTLWNSPRTNA